jgi:transcriptional regulator with GAF, ATPase, and Fis domain
MEDFSTLLLGDTGSGKGAAARAIGNAGFIPYDPRSGRFTESFTRSFIAINLSQFSEALIESELFGHRKGSFTGAMADREGVFARCLPHGTIFLDEIGDVSTTIQLKLLQVLQERTFRPVGGHDLQRFSGRVIAATNRSLLDLRHRGDFRDDFYYRLCSDVIEVPPLRQRIAEDAEELPRLVTGLLARQLNPEAAEALAGDVLTALRESPGDAYPWPGNVRELEQALRRILVCGRYTPETRETTSTDPWLEQVRAGTLNAPDLLAGYCTRLWRETGTYESVAKRTGLDRRTVKKYVLLGLEG